MQSVVGSGKRRIIAVLAAVAVIVVGIGLAFNTVEAASSVTPQTGPEGKVVNGTYKGKAQKLQTMLFQVDLNGQTSYMFCIDISTYIQFGVSYDESSWTTSKVPNLANIARILSQTNATTTKDPVEIAAAQAAIWHFSDGFELDAANPKNDPAVTARYNALVSDATTNPVANEPAGTLSVTPASTSVAQGQPVFYDVATTATAPLSIELSDASVSAHPANGQVCDTATTITSVTGNSRICLTSKDARSNVKMTVRTASAPVSAGRVFIRPQRQKLIIGKSGAAQSSETVTVSWTANGRPTVSVTCPSGGVVYGQPTTFTAKASDPDGDALTYTWTVNGNPVAGQTGASATLTLASGDKVGVAVTDVAGQVAMAEANCPGKNKPTVVLQCPDQLVLGQQNTFTAVGSDPDGDQISYQWSVNGKLLTGTTGPTLTTVVNAGDDIRVVVADSTALVSDSVQASCIPAKSNKPPTVTLSCPNGLTYGQPATFTATGNDPDGDPLTYSWSINGTVVPGAAGATADLTVGAGDKVSVVVSDGELASAAAEVSCTGNTSNKPPTVKVSCPSHLTYRTPTDFTATGSDPDGDPLTYTWTINGAPVAGQTGPTAKLTVNAGDKVGVTVSDGKASSEASTVTCKGDEPNRPPTVSITCPVGLVWGTEAEFVANGSDPDGDTLTYEWKVNGDKIAGSGSKVKATVAKGDTISVVVTDDRGLSSASVNGECTGNSRPTVELTCPTSVLYGEPVTFTAIGNDADGDFLTYVWKVNGKQVDGATAPSANLMVQAGDRVNVTVVDGRGAAAASVTVQCTGTSRPTVTITCPLNLVYGEPMDFIANGVDPDGDSTLTYNWYLNGTPVAGVSGPKLTTAVVQGDLLTVTVADGDGAVSASAAADCTGNHRPTVALVCPEQLVFGQPSTFTATGDDADGDELTYEWKVNDDVVDDQTSATADLTIAKGDRVTVTASDDAGLTSSVATSTCTGTSRPTVATTCPATVVWGEPVAYEAVGTDDDGDTLTYAWAVNGTPVADVTGPVAKLTLQQGDVVTVTVTDPTGLASDTSTFDCAGKERPKVALECPGELAFGRPTALTATSPNADVSKLLFTWALNGKVIEGALRPTVTLTLQPDDTVGLTALDADGLVAVTIGVRCSGTVPPDTPIPPVPSEPQVLASTVYKAATQSTTLATTGGEALAMAGVALAALAAGLVLVGLSRRRSHRNHPAQP